MKDFNIPFSLREDIGRHIEKRVESLEKGFRQNVGIIGPPGLGKTRLLNSFFTDLCLRPTLLPIYIQSDAPDFDTFVDRWIGAVLSSLFCRQEVRPQPNVPSLLRAAEPIVPHAAERIRELKKLVRKEQNSACVRELFSLPRLVADEASKKAVLILDEFDALEKLPTPDPFILLGKEIMIAKNIFYLAASSKPVRAREIFHDKLSLLFGNFEILPFQTLSFSEAFSLIERTCPQARFSPLLKYFLIRMTDGHPVYLERILEHIPASERDIQEGEVLNALLVELFNEKGRLFYYFERYVEACRSVTKDSAPYLRAILGIAHGRRKALAIAAFIGKRVREAKNILQRLSREELIVKRGSFYMIEDYLARFWLREVYQKREQLYGPDRSASRESLFTALARELEGCRSQIAADVPAKVQALFKEFRNDVVELDQRKIRCPQFSEIAFRPSNGRVFPVFARSPSMRWLCQVAEQHVGEEDVNYLLEESRRYRKTIQRKVLIALAGIDQNAKLMAQEAKIQLWDLRSFNALLDLYDLPKMIVTKKA